MAQSALYAVGVIRSCLWEKTLWDASRLPSHKETAVRSGLWRSWWRVDLSSGSLDLGSRLLSTTYRVPTFGSVPSVHSSGCRYCQCQATDLTGCTSCCLAPLWLGKLWPWQQELLGNTHGLWLYRVVLALWHRLVVGSRWGLAVSFLFLRMARWSSSGSSSAWTTRHFCRFVILHETSRSQKLGGNPSMGRWGRNLGIRPPWLRSPR